MVDADCSATLVNADKILCSVADSDEDVACGNAENLLTVLSRLFEDEVTTESLTKKIQLKSSRCDLEIWTSFNIEVDGLTTHLNDFLDFLFPCIYSETKVSAKPNIRAGNEESDRATGLTREASGKLGGHVVLISHERARLNDEGTRSIRDG